LISIPLPCVFKSEEEAIMQENMKSPQRE